MRVRYNIKNVHYALATQGTGGVLTYGPVKAIPGAVSIALEASGEEFTEYADGIEWFKQALNNGYNGPLEVEELPDEFREDCLGEEKDGANVLFEKANALMSEFALGFQFDYADDPTVTGKRTWLLRCKASRPAINGSTKTNTIDPNHESINISAMPRISDDYVKASCVSTNAKYASWFESVITKTASTGTGD